MKTKYIPLFLTAVMFCHSVQAQLESVTQRGSIRITKEMKPPILNIEPGSIRFVDANNNHAIDANEQSSVNFTIVNDGVGDGYGCTVRLNIVGDGNGITFQRTTSLDVIPKGAKLTVSLPISSSISTLDGTVEISVQVDEPNGMGIDPFHLTVETRAFEAPLVKVQDYTLTGTQSSQLEKKKPFDLQVLVQNTQYGTAEKVTAQIQLPPNVMMLDGEQIIPIGTLKAGQTKSLVYSLVATNNYTDTVIPITIYLKESYNNYAENRTITLAMNQTFSTNKIEVKAEEEQREEIILASLTSDVDKNIPRNSQDNKNTFAYIVANENYKDFSRVPFALNDGESFKKYCLETLGLPKDNVRIFKDVTSGVMASVVEQMKNTAKYNQNENIIFYYAGHGAPTVSTSDAYLVPVDAATVNGVVCYSLQQLYDEMGEMPTERVTVFLDACFTGRARDGEMLAANGERLVEIRPKGNRLSGNVVVFSATSNNETAQPYHEQNHGFFTYFLLKKLQETKGEVTYAALQEYLGREVPRVTNNINTKAQTPTMITSPTLGSSWQNWKLR